MRCSRLLQPSRRRGGAGKWLCTVLLSLLLVPGLAAAQDFVTSNPYKVEAAFLLHFTHYVTWPAQTFTDTDAPWRVCILGKDPFGDVLEATFRGRTEQGRSFKIYRASTLSNLPRCQIVYIAYVDPTRLRAVLSHLRGQPVLTVGEPRNFLREGGIIRLRQGKTVQMSINLDQARAAALTIQTKMLEVSAGVLENGVERKVR